MLPGILRKPKPKEKNKQKTPANPIQQQQGPTNQQNKTKTSSKPHKTENKQ